MAAQPVEIALTEGMAAAEAVEEHRSAVVEAVTEGVYRELGEQLAPFGQSGKDHCRQDIHSHLDYLTGSLVAGNAASFGDYLIWLSDLLRARHVPTDSVALSADLLAECLRERLSPDHYRAVLTIIEGGKEALAMGAEIAGTFRTPATAEYDAASTDALADSLLTGNQTKAQQLIAPVIRDSGYLAMAVGLLQPALYRIGERWQAREISVAQEHLATALAQKFLAQQFATAPVPSIGDSKAIFACVANNHHSLGLRIVADAFELDGWSVEFLGADTPTLDLLERIQQTRPDLVGLSVALVRQLPELKEAIKHIRDQLHDQAPRIVAGGLGLLRVSGVEDRLGLDGWSPTALTAVGHS